MDFMKFHQNSQLNRKIKPNKFRIVSSVLSVESQEIVCILSKIALGMGHLHSEYPHAE